MAVRRIPEDDKRETAPKEDDVLFRMFCDADSDFDERLSAEDFTKLAARLGIKFSRASRARAAALAAARPHPLRHAQARRPRLW